jgi:hypothetical protein
MFVIKDWTNPIWKGIQTKNIYFIIHFIPVEVSSREFEITAFAATK